MKMDIKVLIAIIGGVSGLVGGVIALVGRYIFWERERKAQQNDQMLSLYSQWAYLIREQYNSYIGQYPRKTEDPTPVELKIRFLENDKEILDAVEKILHLFPHEFSDKYYFEAEAASSDPAAPAEGFFDDKIRELSDMVKKKYI